MSHVALVKVSILDLGALKRACANLGLEFKENQHTYKWFGQSVGDYAIPQGFTAKELGKCDHAIGIPDNNKAYEIGVCKAKDGSASYVLMWDFWQGGFGLQAVVGKDCEKLVHEYAKEVAKEKVKALTEQGWSMTEEVNENTQETTITLRNYNQQNWN